MSNTASRAETAPTTSPIVAAFLRAFELDQAHQDGHADDPDAQFAWAAEQGARERVLECGINSPDHLAAVALIVLKEIDLAIGGYAYSRDGRDVVAVEDLHRELYASREALKGIWRYAATAGGEPVRRLEPLARDCGAEARHG